MLSHICLNWVLLLLLTGSTVSESIVIGEVGQDITVPCHYSVRNRNSLTSMCWGRDRCPNSKCSQPIIWTDGWRVTEQRSSRYQLKGDLQRGDVSLTIVDAREADSGTYCCRVEIPGWFNDQVINHKVVVHKAPPVTTTSTTTSTTSTTTEAPVFFSEYFTETTSAPQATSDLQPTPETTVLLTTSTLPPATTAPESPPATTAPESPAVTTWETSAPPATAGTENDIFPVTVVETSAPPGFPTTSQAADVTTEDDTFCSTLPGSTEVTTEFPGTLPSAEETTTSVLMEELSAREVSVNSDGNAGKYEDRGDKLPSSAIVIACVIAGCILLGLLVWKRKKTKKFIVKSVGPPEETDKVFSGAEGENNIFSL
ncbi:unnamed protein product [Coccothraustes coccothraustes]